MFDFDEMEENETQKKTKPNEADAKKAPPTAAKASPEMLRKPRCKKRDWKLASLNRSTGWFG